MRCLHTNIINKSKRQIRQYEWTRREQVIPTKEGLHYLQGYFFHLEASFGVNKHVKEIPRRGLADGVDFEAHLGWFQGHDEASDGSFCPLYFTIASSKESSFFGL